MKKSKTKVLAWVLSIVVIASISVYGTFAYLTTEETVVNTFTVGQVDIELDEAKVTPDGKIDGTERVKQNEYHLMPGRTYVKDPTITVKKGSKESYVRILVTLNKVTELKKILGEDFKAHDYVSGWDSKVWEYAGAKEVDNDTITYEFRYSKPVDGTLNTKDQKLDALFDSISIPGEIDRVELASIKDFQITIIGHAIQKAGFDTADVAWQSFEKQQKQ